ncbi:hypothetical protein [Motiliproteus sp.]|uniref:hypothetical protein n=1 Tax=Motiliproteus sp. TaxID=1898955 RepID=UPI003BAAA5A9
MRLILVVLLFTLIGCSKDESEGVSVNFPLYKSCDLTLQKVKNLYNLGAKSNPYDVIFSETIFDSTPSLGHKPYGYGSIELIGDLEILDGKSKKELLISEINSMYAECMPNTYTVVSDSYMVNYLKRRANDNYVEGYIRKDKLYLYFNDGNYKYPE